MNKERFLQIVDECVDQQLLAKKIVAEEVTPKVDAVLAKVVSGEIDLIKGTDVDKVVLMTILERFKAELAKI